ncbi:hypothetical protein FQA39_LY04626 [Lamprigera yunnana]|nr:hypothetical protein FQA39_LY04626 [Lamprigera yunnana]
MGSFGKNTPILTFENPNIIIYFKYKDYLKERDSKRCGFTLDNNELAHEFFPSADNSVSEIHINQNKDWNEKLYDISKDKLSLFITLAHKIGHAIGIDHSPIHQSLMHSVYHEPTSPFNAEDFELSDDDQLAVASFFGKNTPILTFENPNIIIYFKYKDRDSKRCGFTLDNNELAHEFFPSADNSVSEIHINQNKDWNEKLYDISKDKLSLFITLAHKIGHAIGIDHSPIHQSLMHSVYHEPTSPFNAEDFELSDDDQLAVASLYGQFFCRIR